MAFKVRKNHLRTVLYLSIALVIVVLTVLLLGIWEQQHYQYTPSGESTGVTDSKEADEPDTSYSEENGDIYYLNEWYTPKSVKTFLLVGVDKYLSATNTNTYVNTQQADFLMLVVIDDETESYKVVHINRDTMTGVNVLGVKGDILRVSVEQIALSHTYGSGQEDSAENTVTAVSELFYGADIDHYITVTMDAVMAVNDAVGGVTLTAMDTIGSDIIEGETVTLLGEDALSYVRTRIGLDDSTNLHRMERQKQYLEALKAQFEKKASEDAGLFLTTVLEISEYMVSDCTINELSELYSAMHSYEMTDYLTLEGEATVGEVYMEYYVDEDALYELWLDLFYNKAE